MSVDYSKVLLNYDGTPWKFENRDMTLRDAIIAILSTPIQTDAQMPPLELYSLGEIGSVVSKGLALSSEQKAKLKDRTPKVFSSPAIVFTIHNAIEEIGAKATK